MKNHLSLILLSVSFQFAAGNAAVTAALFLSAETPFGWFLVVAVCAHINISLEPVYGSR